jgi:hypothetical protein
VTAGDTALVWDVGLRHAAAAVRRGETDLAELWAALADPDKAWRAMARLAESGDSAVTFVRQRIRPVPRGTDAHLDRIFRALDANRFPDREAASKELDALGAAAVGRVKARLKPGVPEEVRARVGRYLAKYDRPGPHADELRSLRAVEVLEAIGTEAAKGLLRELTRGDDTAPLTREARETLRRLDP